MTQSTFLSCDWGTSHFRLRLIDTSSLKIVDEIKTAEGAGQISRETAPDQRPQKFENIFITHARHLFARTGASADVCVISGMASSNIGWHELPYAATPVPLQLDGLATDTFEVRVTEDRTITVILVSGIRTNDDVMRGEETELLGLVHLLPHLKSSNVHLILPGTHSKHVRLENGVLTGFTTYMTGELYAHLQSMPTLKVPLSGDDTLSESEFLAGVDCVAKAGLMASLFKIRTRSVLSAGENLHGPSFLSGLLIGAELADLDPEANLGIYLCCSTSLIRQYSLAVERRGLPLRIVPPEVISQSVIQAHRTLLPS